MLKAHIDSHEQQLLATSRIPANSGHPLHKGTPREAFIRQFLQDHLSETIALGTGEIIDCNSKPREPRNQIDIVLYRRSYPKLDFGGGISGFLAESVVATIEVKSVLDVGAMRQSIQTAKNVKALTRNVTTAFTTGFQPPAILNYVVAYDGPASMQTVAGWFPVIHAECGIIPRRCLRRLRRGFRLPVQPWTAFLFLAAALSSSITAQSDSPQMNYARRIQTSTGALPTHRMATSSYCFCLLRQPPVGFLVLGSNRCPKSAPSTFRTTAPLHDNDRNG